MSRILVTGGAGFVGSHVVDALVARRHEVRVLDSLHPNAHGARPEHLNSAAEYRWGDLRRASTVRDALAGVDAVCHQAAMVGLGIDFADAPAYVDHNDHGTAVLLAALHERRFAGRIVLAGSMVVYGEGSYRCATDGTVRPGPRDSACLERGEWEPACPKCRGPLTPEPVPETASVDPRNVYAATKLHQEHLCYAFGREHSVPVTVLRYHNVYGRRMPSNTPYAGVAAIFRSALENGDAPLVFEDGQQLRDFVHVHDVARANVLALEADPPVTSVLNVASGRPRSVLGLAHALSPAFGSDAPTPRVVGTYRLGDVRHVFAATDAARDQLGFAAEISFEVGMGDFALSVPRSRPQI